MNRQEEFHTDMNTGSERDGRSLPFVNYFLIAVNVLVFAAGVVLAPGGQGADFFYRRGGLYAPLILKGQDFFRLVTSIFLHADAGHLMNNMIMQFAGGEIAERNLGHFRYGLLYLLSGIGGNLASVLADYLSGSYSYSIGASGAVFGVTGTLLWLILEEARESRRSREARGQDRGLSPRLRSLVVRAGLMTVFMLYSGQVNPVVNQAAHVGGLICGFLLAAVLMPRGRRDLRGLL